MRVDPETAMRLMEEGNAISLGEVANRMDASLGSVHRWTREGLRGIKLETYKAGGRWKTTEAALARFISAITEAAFRTSPNRTARELGPAGMQRRAAAARKKTRELRERDARQAAATA